MKVKTVGILVALLLLACYAKCASWAFLGTANADYTTITPTKIGITTNYIYVLASNSIFRAHKSNPTAFSHAAPVAGSGYFDISCSDNQMCGFHDATDNAHCVLSESGPTKVFTLPTLPSGLYYSQLRIGDIVNNQAVLSDTDGNVYLNSTSHGWSQICATGTNGVNPVRGCPGISRIAISADGEIFGNAIYPTDNKLYRYIGSMTWEPKASLTANSITAGNSISEVAAVSYGSVYQYNYSSTGSGSWVIKGTGSFDGVAVRNGEWYAFKGSSLYKWV